MEAVVTFCGCVPVKLNHLESKSLDMRQTRILLAGKEDERSGGVSCFPRFSIEMNRPKV